MRFAIGNFPPEATFLIYKTITYVRLVGAEGLEPPTYAV